MTGVDISSEFLAAARSAAEQRELSVRWEQRAMHDLPGEAAFDGAFCMGALGLYLVAIKCGEPGA